MEETEVNIPPFFNELKKTTLMKHAVIAGGYLRDQYLHINPKDIDIFVPVVGLNGFINNFLNDTVTKLDGPVFREVTYAGDGSRYFGDNNGKAQFVKFDCITNDGHEVDIMAMRMNVTDFGNLLIEGFPYGNQQVFHDGKKIFYTKTFQNDIEDHRMTLVNCDTLENFQRIYPKFTEMKDRYLKEMGYRLRFGSDYILTKRSGDDWL